MISIDIVENGSSNHPFYLKIFVDDLLVASKSFMSKKLAEKGTDKFVQEVLMTSVRKLRKFSESHFKLNESTIDYPGSPSGFRGTGHFD